MPFGQEPPTAQVTQHPWFNPPGCIPEKDRHVAGGVQTSPAHGCALAAAGEVVGGAGDAGETGDDAMGADALGGAVLCSPPHDRSARDIRTSVHRIRPA
jgi:hypothetical protein